LTHTVVPDAEFSFISVTLRLQNQSLFPLMEHRLTLYNTLSRKKELFVPLQAPHVGMYVCGPTVYGDAHLGHARPAITFDVLFRYLTHLGYKVRYVRNVTDVGHLEHDADHGEDKIAKKARLERVEPMEVAQHYLNRYRKAMEALGVLPPSIEPQASGHIIEQIELVKSILAHGFAYESHGSVYFDVVKYNGQYHYGKLSGRNLEEVLNTSRALEGQEEKHNPADFALWKRAQPEHIMRWPSPWSDGFPGWHCECTAMGKKYLGAHFDIHGGGMDLVFPHHECEIAQAVASQGDDMVRYWMHNNMITINGQKMGKSYGNFINLGEFFHGTHPLLTQAYAPMTIRFFILQAHYRSTVDFGNEALQAAEKGLARLTDAMATLERLVPAAASSVEVAPLRTACYEAMNDDLNTPIVIAHLFEAARIINNVAAGNDTLSADDIDELRTLFQLFCVDLLGLGTAAGASGQGREEAFGRAVDLLLAQRMQAKAAKDWATSDGIRDSLTALGFEIKDTKEGTQWKLNK
jgi:cysteinyl-tRNA synthetase